MQKQQALLPILAWATINGLGFFMRFTSPTLCLNGRQFCGRSCLPTLISLFFAFGRSCTNLPTLMTRSSQSSSWGTAAMCSGAVNTFAQLLATRSLLGIFESVFGCGAPYFLSLFYQRKELGLRVSLLLGMSPIANCFASALAYGITHIKGSMESWRYLFIIGSCTQASTPNSPTTNTPQRAPQPSYSP